MSLGFKYSEVQTRTNMKLFQSNFLYFEANILYVLSTTIATTKEWMNELYMVISSKLAIQLIPYLKENPFTIV